MVKINFVSLVEYYKNILSYLKKASAKSFTLIRYGHKASLPNNQANLLNKINNFNTKLTNKYFVITIIVSCLMAMALSYCEQRHEFEQRLLAKSQLIHSRIEKTIQNYQISLNAYSQVILGNQRYLDPIKIVQILKLAYSVDDKISLSPLNWQPASSSSSGLYKSYSAFGSKDIQPDELLLSKLRKTPHQSLTYDQVDKFNIINLIIVHPVVEQGGAAKDQNLIGYFKMSIKMPLLLKTLYDCLADDDLLRISNDTQVIYFTKKEGIFRVNNSPDLEKHQFANDLIFASPYKISVGQDTKRIITDSLQVTGLRCGIILALGSVMLLIYNYVERRKAKKLYQDNGALVEEIAALQQQVADLTTKYQESENISKQNHNYNTSAIVINDIEQQIKQDLKTSLLKIQDISLLKRHDANKKITTEMLDRTLVSIHKVSEDLIHNIVSRNSHLVEVNLTDLFAELLVIFAPVITIHSLKLEQKIDRTNIIVNELVLKQVLVSLLIRSLRSAQEGSNVKISVSKDKSNDTIAIEITNDGYNVNEQLLKSIMDHSKNDLPLSITNIQLEYELIERVVKEILAGELKIPKKNQNNQITLSLPIKRNKYEDSDKIIAFDQIVKR